MGYTLTPRDLQTLGITDQDIASFSDESIQLTPEEIKDSILDIIEGAYERVPKFRALVDEDAAKDPTRLGRSAMFVGKLLKHLHEVLPPEKKMALQGNVFSLAHDMVVKTLQDKLKKPEAPAVVEEKIDPITDSDLALFNMPKTVLTDKTKWPDIKNYILFFLGKLKDANGKTIKNEATKGMQDDLKIKVLEKLFNDLRQKKLEASGGTLSPSDEKFVGKDIRQLKIMARSMVVPTPGKPDPVYVNDLIEVNSQSGEALNMISRIQEIFKDKDFTDAINELTQALDTALPPVNLFEDRIKSIQEEISKLGLTKSQAMTMTQVDPSTLSYGDPVKKLIEDQRIALQGIQKEIAEKGSTPDRELKLNNIQGQLKQLDDLSKKDTSGLKGAIEDYLSTLRAYKDNIKTNISEKKLDDRHQSTLTEFTRMVDRMALVFSRLTREELFRARWSGRSGMLIRGEKPAAPETPEPPEPPEAPIVKMAADPASPEAPGATDVAETTVEKPAGYAAKLHAFKGKGLGDAYNEIQSIVEDNDKLPAIKGKLIDILGHKDRIEAINKIFQSKSDPKVTPEQIKEEVDRLTEGTMYGPQITEILEKHDDLDKLQQIITNILSKDKTVMTQTEGVSHDDIGLGDAVKMVVRLRTLVKKLKIEDKGTEALDVISWAADLKNHIKSGKTKKLASVVSAIRKFARTLLGATEDKPVGMRGEYQSPGDTPGEKHKGYQSPAGVGSDKPLGSAGKAGWIIFRQRMTKMGKKTLQSFFEEPTFIADFVEEMEKTGLNDKLLRGDKIEEQDINPALEAVLRKVTGKTGNLENILGSLGMQEKNIKYLTEKAKKELEDARARKLELDNKIMETENRYLPKLQEFAEFIKDPIGATREQMEDLKKRGREKGPDKEKGPRGEFESIKPENIGAANYRSVLRQLVDRYKVQKTPALYFYQDSLDNPKMAKQAKDIEKLTKKPYDMIRVLPAEFVKQYLVWKKQLKNAKVNIDKQSNPYKKAVELEKYYSFMIVVANRVSDYLDYQNKVFSADETMIKGIESFLKSDDAKGEKPQFIKDSEILLDDLKRAFSYQKKIFDSLKGTHTNIQTVIDSAEDQLKTIQEDIADKKVDMVYQVAISPDLVPDKETALRIKQRAKEHEKGLSFIIDRSTYKNNMNRLMTFKVKHGPFKSYPGEGVKVLDPERKKGLEDTLRNFEERVRQMKQEADSGMREIALKKMESDLDKAKAIVESGNELLENYRILIENMDFLDANKDTMDPAEYNKQVAATNNLLKSMHIYQEESSSDVKAKKADLKRDVKNEKAYLERIQEHINQLEGGAIEKARKEFETNRPPVNVPKQMELMLQKLYRLRGMDLSGPLKSRPLPEQIAVTEDKINQIKELSKVPVNAAPGTPGEQAYNKFKKELEHILEVSIEDLEELKKKQGTAQPGVPMAKMAAQGDPTGDEGKSTYEKALDKKGIKPAPYMQELPKPKGWDIVENFFNEVKREHKLLKRNIAERTFRNLQTGYLKKRMNQIENMAEAIDMYKNQKVTIGGDPVAFRDVMTEFEKTLSDYQDILAKYTNQRDDAINRIEYARQELDHYSTQFDPETGEFKGLHPEEIANLKGIFLQMLYRDLDKYWASRVGKDLSVLGERDTNWYDNVYRTFKNIAGTRSNRKMLGLVNKYKQETRSDFDDDINRMKSQQLEKERDKLLKGYEEFGIDPTQTRKLTNLPGVDPMMSSRLSTLNTRIETLKKQEKQMGQIFDYMGIVDAAAKQAEFVKMLRDKAAELESGSEEPLTTHKITLEKKVDAEIDKAIDTAEKDIKVIAEHARESELAEKELKELKGMVEERGTPIPAEKPAEPSVGKMAFDKNHRDFNLKILYGSYMQSKIAEMLSEEMK